MSRAARIWGIQEKYWDIWGHGHVTTELVNTRILTALGVDCASAGAVDRAVEARLWTEWSRLAPPTAVVNQSDARIELSIPEEAAAGEVEFAFEFEDGSRARRRVSLSGMAVLESLEIRGVRFRRVHAGFHGGITGALPLGYHSLSVTLYGAATKTAAVRLVVCPDRAYQPPCTAGSKRVAGVAVSLYGLRSERNWGVGDFTDLERLIDWLAPAAAGGEIGAAFVALNPLHTLANRTPYNISPYLPISIFFRNPLYLDLERIAEFTKSPGIANAFERRRGEIAALRSAEFVAYEPVWRLKLKFLRVLFREFLKDPARREELRAYVESEGPRLRVFALYSALDEALHKHDRNLWIWPEWPEEYRSPDSPESLEFERTHPLSILFWQYVQWQVDGQLKAAQAHARAKGMPIGLYHDLALATDRCGADLWAYRKFFVSGCRVGSPPDGFAPKGQDWAFPPPDVTAHFEDGFQLFRDTIRNNARHGGALRIDHVMRFFRLYWIPDGMEATDGAYVRDRAEDLIRILALESVRGEFVVIGEDLGTVEPGLREMLAKYGILSYRLLYFEKGQHGGFKLPAEYPSQALVSSTTHDLPTLAGFWMARDIQARRNAGLLGSDENYYAQLADRAGEKQKLLEALHFLGLLPADYPGKASVFPELTGEIHNAITGFLAQTPAKLLVLNQEDLTKETEQQNLPGSTWQYPNWQRKMRFSIEDLWNDQSARDFAAMFRHWLVKSGRAL